MERRVSASSGLNAGVGHEGLDVVRARPVAPRADRPWCDGILHQASTAACEAE